MCNVQKCMRTNNKEVIQCVPIFRTKAKHSHNSFFPASWIDGVGQFCYGDVLEKEPGRFSNRTRSKPDSYNGHFVGEKLSGGERIFPKDLERFLYYQDNIVSAVFFNGKEMINFPEDILNQEMAQVVRNCRNVAKTNGQVGRELTGDRFHLRRCNIVSRTSFDWKES